MSFAQMWMDLETHTEASQKEENYLNTYLPRSATLVALRTEITY